MPFLAALVVVAASYGAGVAVTANGRLTGGRDLRGRATVFALGFAAFAAAALLVGVLGAFTPVVLDTIAAACALVGTGAAIKDVLESATRVREHGVHDRQGSSGFRGRSR